MPRKPKPGPSTDISRTVYSCECGASDASDFVVDEHTDDIICTKCGCVATMRAFANYELPLLPRSSYMAVHYWRERIRQLWNRDSEPSYFTDQFIPLCWKWHFNSPDRLQLLEHPATAKAEIRKCMALLQREKHTPKLNYMEKWIKIRYVLSDENYYPNYDVVKPDCFESFIKKMDKWYRRVLNYMKQERPEKRSHNCNCNMLMQVAIYALYGEHAWIEFRDYLNIIANKQKRIQIIKWIEKILNRTEQLNIDTYYNVIVSYWLQPRRKPRINNVQKRSQQQIRRDHGKLRGPKANKRKLHTILADIDKVSNDILRRRHLKAREHDTWLDCSGEGGGRLQGTDAVR